MGMDWSSLEHFIASNNQMKEHWQGCKQLACSAEDKITAKFKRLNASSDYEALANYSSPDGDIVGGFQAFSGPGVDWLSCHWQGDYSRQHLEISLCAWLNQKTRVPHFVLTLGAIPGLYFYQDFIPRCNPVLHPDYVDQYYAPLNQAYMDLHKAPELSPQTAPHPLLRASASPVAQHVTGELNGKTLEHLTNYCEDNMNEWLHWLDQADPITKAERPAQRAYDFILRRQVYDTDEGYAQLRQSLGQELTELLIAAGVGESQMTQARQNGH